MKPPIWVWIFGVVIQGFAAAAFAQDPTATEKDIETTLPPVVVQSAPPPPAKPKPVVLPPKKSPIASENAPAPETDQSGGGQRPGLASASPTATSEFDQEQLANWQVQRVESVLRAVPNANLSGFGEGRSTMVTFRGVGPLIDPFAPDDNTVVVYIDGIPQLLFAGDASLFDLERVEILKGPQGTRSGWNTTGGAIDYVTRKPTGTTEGNIRLEAGEQGNVLTDVAASDSLPDGSAAARVAIRYSNIDGFVPNVATGNDVGGRRIAAARSTIVLNPSPDTKVTMAVRAENDDRTFPYFLLRDTDGFPVALQSIDGMNERSQAGGSLIVERTLESVRFTSLSGVSGLSSHSLVDDTDGFLFSKITGLPPAAFASDGTLTDWQEDQQLWTQEFRWAALKGSSVDWVAGITLLHNRFEADYFNTHAFFAVSNGRRLNALETTSVAAFGEVTIPIAHASRLTGGLRVNHDDKAYDSRFVGIGFPGTVGSFVERGHLDYDYVTGRVSLAHDLGRHDSISATVSRGEKSGGFPRLVTNAALGIATEPYKSTKIMAYEAGYRHAALNGTGTSYAGVFFNDVMDEQLFVFDAATFSFIPDNMDTQSYGVEFQIDWRLAPPLRLSAGLGVTIAEIKNVTLQQQAMGARDGNRPTNTPAVTAFARLDYREKVPELGLGPEAAVFADIGWSYVGERAATVANDFFLDDLHLIDARVGLSMHAGWELYAFGRNLLDITPELTGNFIAGAEAIVPERGRVAGIGMAANW